MTMLDNKGPEYVQGWPDRIAAANRCSVEYVARALTAVTGQEVNQSAFYGATGPHPVVAALDGPTATAVVARVREMMAEIERRRRTHCHTCGLPLTDGRCEECV